MRSERLPVYEKSGKARCVKPCKQSIHHNDNIKLLVTALVLSFLSCQPLVKVFVVRLNLPLAKMSTKHPIVIPQGL